MNLSSSSILLPALRWLLANRLQKALQLRYAVFREINPFDYPEASYLRQQDSTPHQKIPLTRNRDITQISYTSAIALRVANEWQRSPKEIADEIYQELLNLGKTSVHNENYTSLELDLVWNYVSIQVASSGWMSFVIHPHGLAAWLHHLIHQPVRLNQFNQGSDRPDPRTWQFGIDSASLFFVQYTHARCHSLFRLAQQEGLLKPKEPQPADRISDWLHDIEISWIGADGHLRTHHPTEQQFISQLVHTLDEIVRLDASLNATVGLQLAHGLSQSFQAFYAACRIWDETRLALPELVHARLGLIGITQSVLRSLLIDVIGTAAPIEL